MRAFLAVLAIVLIGTGPARALAAEDLQEGLRHLRAREYEQARVALTRVVESQWAAPELQGQAYSLRAYVNFHLGDMKTARADADRAVELLREPSSALVLRVALTWRTGEKELAMQDLMRIARKFPDKLTGVEPRGVREVLRWLKEVNRADERFALLQAVVEAGYQPADPGLHPDELLKDYMAALIERGRADRALPWVGKIIDTDQLIEMRVSKRFEPLWDKPLFDRRTQPRAAAERERAYWELEAAKHPRSLHIVRNRIDILDKLGDLKAAIRLGRAALKQPDLFADRDDYVPWIRNELLYVLNHAGRPKEADAVIAPLLKRSVEKEPYLVNQFLNYAEILLRRGEFERALSLVGKTRKWVTPYGRKWIESTEACAIHRLGRATKAEAALVRVKTHPEENHAAVSRTLLCFGRVDEAVALTLARLRDPEHRDDMLTDLQKYKDWPALSPFDEEMRARRAQVHGNPKVVKEARKYGRVLDIPLY